MYDAFIKPILLHNAGTNDAPVSKMKIVDATHRRHIRHMLGIYYPDRISNQKLYEISKQDPISPEFTRRGWKLFGHVLRQKKNTPAREIMWCYYGRATEGTVLYKVGGQHNTTTLPGILGKDHRDRRGHISL